MGDYPRAESFYLQALQIMKKVLGPEHPETVDDMNGLAEVYRTIGEYSRAEALCEQAILIWNRTRVPANADAANSLNDLALLYLEIGDYAKTETLLRQSLDIDRKARGPESPNTATCLNNLGGLYLYMGDYAKAEPYFRQTLEIRKKVLGPDNPDIALCLTNLGAVYTFMGNYAKAEPLFQEELQIRRKVFGTEHPNTANSLSNLGSLYWKMGNYAKAEPFYQQALQIYEKRLGAENPETASCLYSFSLLKFDLGENPEAKSLAQLSGQADLASLSKVLSFASEQQRLAFENKANPRYLFSVLNGTKEDPATAILRYKGIVLDSIIEDRLVAAQSERSGDRSLVERLSVTKAQLGQLLLETADKITHETDKKIAELEKEVQQIEEQLAQHFYGPGQARRALSVSVGQVQAAIPNDAALIEYLNYLHYLGGGKFEWRCGAIVLTASGQPKWVPLGPVTDLDTTVSHYQRIVRDAFDEEELSANLKKLYERLWAPVEECLPPGTKQVIISPDGQLNFVSFATLLDPENHFLAEKHILKYVASGRDLLREVKPASDRGVVIFANPSFTLSESSKIANAAPANPETIGATEKRDFENLSFPPLEGTQKECDELKAEFGEWHWHADYLTGKHATKMALLHVHSPYILHLATHGFFNSEQQSGAAEAELQAVGFQSSVFKSTFFKNPMHRSGIALAGAQTTLESWKHGDVPPVENDGIVTAEDVAALDLRGTWLVTLSACDTGSGEARAGEGVLGLRRGFMEAGAQNLLMTLWPISDETTVQIMRDFYDAARKGGSAPEALADTQRDWLTKLRDEKGLVKAVSLAGPFIMTFQGKP
jgi:CHAT domain-containing protein/Tfp pilus assembly protein PilF